MLCPLCSTFDVHALVTATARLDQSRPPNQTFWPATPPFFRYHFGQDEILRHANASCAFCSVVWSVLTTKYASSLEAFLRVVQAEPRRGGQFWITPKAGENGVLIVSNTSPEERSFGGRGGQAAQAALASRMRMRMMTSWSPSDDLEVQLLAGRGEIPRGLESFFICGVPENPYPASILMAEQWLSSCRRSHRVCSKTDKQKNDLPTRVIDVGTRDAPAARLVASQGKKGEWVALSYCWGGANKLMLSTENFASLCQGILLDQLPRTLQDAITCTRMLGIRYLWIDALCIIQNDSEDWDHEASLMRSVYKNATLTISAAAAGRASDGILGSRASTQGPICRLPWRTGSPPSVVVARAGNLSKNIKQNEIAESPLSKRAWCYQESLLSSRTLFFTESTLVWECAATREDEYGNSTPVANMGNQTMALFRGSMYLDRNLAIPTWEVIVSEYTSKSMTVETDMLPALGGLAAEMAHKYPGKYLAGLWECDLMRQLLWLRHNDHSRPLDGYASEPKPQSYIAPSWSWASIHCDAVSFLPTTLFHDGIPTITSNNKTWQPSPKATRLEWTYAKIISAHTETIPDAPFGRVLEGQLTIEGRMMAMPAPELLASHAKTNPLFGYLATEHYPNIANVWGHSNTHMYSAVEREFFQQHREHEGTQTFALLELARWGVKYVKRLFGKKYTDVDRDSHSLRDNGVYLLVLESASEGGNVWRRIGLVAGVEWSEVPKEYRGRHDMAFVRDTIAKEAAWRVAVGEEWERRAVTIV